MIKVGIVDDKFVNRKTVNQNLAYNNAIQIVVEADNGSKFLEKMQALPADKIPDVVLMDIDMPVMNGIDAIAIASTKYPTIKFLVLTVFDDDDKIFEAIQAGALGYLLKDDSGIILSETIINCVQHNAVPMSPAIARKTLQWLKQIPTKATTATSALANENLSQREIDILKLIVDGLDYKQIAEAMFISPHTVRTHTKNIYEKLHINSKAQAIQLAHKHNWV